MLEEGAIRFLMGLSQKLLLADALAPLWSYTSTHSVSMASAWLGLLAYTFQIYFDFQGYMNMAIGLGRMFGIRLQENFDPVSYTHLDVYKSQVYVTERLSFVKSGFCGCFLYNSYFFCMKYSEINRLNCELQENLV